MRVLVIGATGAIGTRLVPQLRDRGHKVIGTSRSSSRLERVRALGADAIVLDALDAGAVRKAVGALRPDVVIYEATALADLCLKRGKSSLQTSESPQKSLAAQRV